MKHRLLPLAKENKALNEAKNDITEDQSKKQIDTEVVPGVKNDDEVKRDAGGQKPKPKSGLRKSTMWTIKIIVATFILSVMFSYISEITSQNAPIAVAFILLILLIVINILFDVVGVSVTACDLAPLLSMASKKVKGSRMAIRLVKNAERVSNICCDVIGDICGIISGACTVTIVVKIALSAGVESFWMSILFSSVVAAFTIGGKAVCKEIAMKNSKELVMFAGRILSLFVKKDKR